MSLLSKIQSGNRVFIQGAAATPHRLIEELLKEAPRLKNVELIHLHTFGEAKYARPEYSASFKVANLFVGANMRAQLDYDRVDYLPCFLSEIPALFRSGKRPIDVALVHVSPPDANGFCTLGTSLDVARAAVDSAKVVIAQINQQMPRVHGDGFVHVSRFDATIEVNEPLTEIPQCELSEVEKKIGRNVAEIVEDGSTLQVGIGSVPDAVLDALSGHKNLGVHTEMWSDGILKLIQLGVVNNTEKTFHKHKTVSGFVMGSKSVYQFLHDNPSVVQYGIDLVNDPGFIRQIPNMVAINSAVEIDLTGQVCADSVGHGIISGVGGQMDFIRGASLAPGGKPIIALTSRTKKGISRLVSQLRPGSGVVTTRCHVHYVATEYGVVNLYGKTLKERAKMLIAIAHPDDRELLDRQWNEYHRRRV